MKILVDAHIGRLIIDFLEYAGHDVLRATSFPPKTSDDDILRAAFAQGRIVITSDKDFGELIFRRLEPSVGVVLLRIDVAHEDERMRVFRNFWQHVERAVVGHFVVVNNAAVRRSPLPTT